MKKFINFLIYPKVYFAIICYLLTILFSFPALIVAILGASGILSIVLFSLSGITFFYSVYTIVYFFPKIKKGTINLLKKSSFIKKILENYDYRTLLFAIFSLTLTCLYGIFNGVIFILYFSIWSGALALYYIILSAMRGGVLYYHKKRKSTGITDKERELTIFRNSGILLIILTVALSSAIAQMIVFDAGFEKKGLMIFTYAAYSFTKLGISIYNVIKTRKYEDRTISAIKCVSFADALMSLLALQTALLHAFAGEISTRLANGALGAVVVVLIILLGVYMIITAKKEIKNLKTQEKTNI
jgi:hypothetical protein